jgi:hypothetical protein
MKALILLIVSLFALVHSQNIAPPWESFTAWSADFICTAPQFGSGIFRGKFVYDWSIGAMNIQYTGAQNYQEFYQFNTDRGYKVDTTTGSQFAFQYLYKQSTACPCETTGLNFAMPPLFLTSVTESSISGLSYWKNPSSDAFTVAGVQVDGTKYFANDAFTVSTPSGPRSYILTSFFWIGKDGKTPQAFNINDFQRRTFILTNVVEGVAGQMQLIAPKAGCKCGKQMDICLSLDRSGSISRDQWTLEYQFTQNLVNAFTYGPLATNMGIVNWNAAVWTTLDITSGTSDSVVKSAVGSMSCCPGASSTSCCCCGTPIGGGIYHGGNCLSKSTRGRSQKVLILLTDGCQNHLYNPTTGAVSCGCSSEKACSQNATCVADITKWYQWVEENIPGTRIIVVGVGGADTICKDQLLLAAGNDQNNVYNPESWSALLDLVETITATACTADSQPCPGCCGLCTCGQCIAPEECVAPDKCTTGKLDATGCCTTESVVCDKKPCQFEYCDGKQGCLYDPIACPDATLCELWTCNNSFTCTVGPNLDSNGQVKPDCTTQKFCDCKNNTDCDDRNNCTKDTCDSVTCKCSNVEIKCKEFTDNCTNYVCKPKEGCVSTPKKCDDKNACTTDKCDPLVAGGCVYTPITCVQPKDKCQYAQCNAQIGCETFPVDCTTKGYKAENCTVPACNETCYDQFICAAPPPTSSETGPDTVVLVSTLTTAAVAGIVIAAVLLAAGLGGGAAVAIAQVAAGGGAVVTASNPLYAGAGIGGDNPLNQG